MRDVTAYSHPCVVHSHPCPRRALVLALRYGYHCRGECIRRTTLCARDILHHRSSYLLSHHVREALARSRVSHNGMQHVVEPGGTCSVHSRLRHVPAIDALYEHHLASHIRLGAPRAMRSRPGGSSYSVLHLG